MDKERIYREAQEEIALLIEGETDPVSRMSTICAVLKERIVWASWVGFYRVVEPRMLAVGPYVGEVGCLRIPFDQGVCGAAARSRKAQIVPDVDAFPGHIACDAAARSEIVLPVVDRSGALIAVLDLDSHQSAAFDERDQAGLEPVVRLAVV
ncbi:MAG: GAF domain-containing protein [Candidatus Eisenbacteria bacterium]|nr:GAF domain-containing protein [Candidatus Eisenbacteria bacterium]